MKSRILMATLVVTLMLGVQSFANCNCGACDPCNPCDNVSCGKSCDLFSGLKNMLASGRCSTECGPCDGIVACNPCEAGNGDCGLGGECNPCDPCGKGAFRPFRGLFARERGCDPCAEVACGDNGCDPCGNAACGDNGCGDNGCGACDAACGKNREFSFRKLFGAKRGCNPCDAVACGDNGCGACDACGLGNGDCGATACDPCDPCNTGCRKFGSIFDKPRRNIKKFFDGFSCASKCDPCAAVNCGPCDMSCNPCDMSSDCGSPIPCSHITPAANDPTLPPAGN